MRIRHVAAAVGMLVAGLSGQAVAFQVEEASIESIQSAIQSGETTCQQVVQAYVDRAKAYNGICTALVTKDGKPVESKPGTVRAGAPLKFPTAPIDSRDALFALSAAPFTAAGALASHAIRLGIRALL